MDQSPGRFPEGSFVRPNQHLMGRLDAMINVMLEAHGGGGTMSSGSKGTERETFVSSFLLQVFPPHFRFGSGDITDADEQKSGQIDIVIEYPNLYSFPMWQSAPRLYLAEGVAVAIEVKSNIANQWDEARDTASKLKKLKRRFRNARLLEEADRYDSIGDVNSKVRALELREAAEQMQSPPEDIPLFVVGYNGWAKVETLTKHLDDSQVDAVLQLDKQFFCARGDELKIAEMGPICLMMFLE